MKKQCFTRQLPIGAGHCPWGGHTDWNGCNIHGEVHLASPCCAILRSWTFSKVGTLPATLATCQYWETFLEDAPCPLTTFGKMPKIVGTLPKVPHMTLPGPDQTKIGPEKAFSVDFWPWPLTLDLDLTKTGMRSPMSIYMPKIRSLGLLAAAGEVVTNERTDGKNHRPLLWISKLFIYMWF